MGGLHDLPLGFVDPVADSQSTFRAVLRALSRPGEPVECAASAPAVPGLMPATVALLLTLTDHETPTWWADGAPAHWLRFHTGAPVAARPMDAQFAVFRHASAAQANAGHTRALPRLDEMSLGTDESPERSTTLLIELPSLAGGAAAEWSGPGLREPGRVHLAGLPEGFWAQWHDNQARFPSGVDVVFVSGRHIVGLPRTTRVRTGQISTEGR